MTVPNVTEEYVGKPLTPELQKVFGYYGKVKGLIVRNNGNIEVQYEDGAVVEYVPILKEVP